MGGREGGREGGKERGREGSDNLTRECLYSTPQYS